MITRTDPDTITAPEPTESHTHHPHADPVRNDHVTGFGTPDRGWRNGPTADAGESRPTPAAGHHEPESQPTASESGSVPADSAELVRTKPAAAEPIQGRDEPLPLDLLIAGYQRLTVPEIIRHAEMMTAEQLREVKEYEKSHRRRKTLLTKIERLLRNPAPAGKAIPTGEDQNPNRP